MFSEMIYEPPHEHTDKNEWSRYHQRNDVIALSTPLVLIPFNSKTFSWIIIVVVLQTSKAFLLSYTVNLLINLIPYYAGYYNSTYTGCF